MHSKVKRLQQFLQCVALQVLPGIAACHAARCRRQTIPSKARSLLFAARNSQADTAG
ncbi:hypothetical protein [Aquabacterium sp.]|uniref:hypothetical protein n=1 Tax=Aquabacterium sp. TaxID=1872578 RepID=UPI002BD6E17E|nr:hypothetical protein [Aquabacterium sp.]HSW05477.1 hypothetical protein [Aquabacterium sp.]